MLTEIYIEALLVDEELADQVWKAWFVGETSTETASMMWWLIAAGAGEPKNENRIQRA
jgi:hypothetical protein